MITQIPGIVFRFVILSINTGSGTLPTDRTKGNHPDVVVSADGRAYLFYFTHQIGADAEGNPAGGKRHTVIQVAELELQDGILTCDRRKPVNIDLVPWPNAITTRRHRRGR